MLRYILILASVAILGACGQKAAEQDQAAETAPGEAETLADAGCALTKEVVFEREAEQDGKPVKQVGYFVANFKKGSDLCKQELENLAKAETAEEGMAKEAMFFTCPHHSKTAEKALAENENKLDEEHTNYCAATYVVTADGQGSFAYAPGGEENLNAVHQE